MYLLNREKLYNGEFISTMYEFKDLVAVQLAEDTYKLTVIMNKNNQRSVTYDLYRLYCGDVKIILKCIIEIININKHRDIVIDNKYIIDYILKRKEEVV